MNQFAFSIIPGLILETFHYANFHVSRVTKVDKSKNIPIILILQDNKNFALIYFDTIENEKQRIVHRHGASNINGSQCCCVCCYLLYYIFS